MTCDEARQWLDADEVPENAARDVAAHRRTCPDCDREFARADRLRRALADLPMPEMSESYWAAYDARLHARLSGARRAGETERKSPRRIPAWSHLARAAALVAAALVVAMLPFVLPRDEPQCRTATTDHVAPEETPADNVAAIQETIRVLEARIAALEEAERRLHLQRRLRQLSASPTPEEIVERELDRAAFLGIHRADRLAADVRSRAEAIQAYRLVIQLFPETSWAEVARARLTDLESSKGGMNDETPHDVDRLGDGRPAGPGGLRADA